MTKFGKGFRQPAAPANKTEVAQAQSELLDVVVNKVNDLGRQTQFLGQMTSQIFNQVRGMAPEVNALSALMASVLVDRPALAGDYVMIDYLGALLDAEGNIAKDEDGLNAYFDGGYGSRYVVLGLTSGSLIPGFEEQLVGKKAGETVVFKIKFPENYHNKELASKETQFTVVIHSIRQPIPHSAVDLAKIEHDVAKNKIRQEKLKAQQEAEAAKAAAEKAAQEAAAPAEAAKPALALAPTPEDQPASGEGTPSAQ